MADFTTDPIMSDRVTNDKMVVDQTFEGLQKLNTRMEERLTALEAQVQLERNAQATQLAGQQQVLFANLVTQQQQLFNASLRDLNAQVTIGLKALDISATEISEQAITSKTVADLSPVITKAVDAAVAGNVGNVSVSNSAIAAAVAAAVVAALESKAA
ncbi:MAG: hypothetical protein WCI74_14675 [Actinomycetes bacterium]